MARPLRPMWAVADTLGRSRETVRAWIKAGLLEHVSRDPDTGQVLVNMLEVQQLGEQHPPRATRRQSVNTGIQQVLTPPCER